MREQIALGRQVFIVYPLIKESEKMDYKNLIDGYVTITEEFPAPKYVTAVVHGQQKPENKAFDMDLFVKGKANILVATSVIEVGVDVPNASVMVIESAERFGLSQLHQLRGRVGRGADKSYCILMTAYNLGDDSRKRIAKVDVNGLASRIVCLPPAPGRYRIVAACNGKLFYSSFNGMPGGPGPRGPQGGGPGLQALDLKTLKSSEAGKKAPLALTADHKKALVSDAGKFYVTSFGPNGAGRLEEPLAMSDMDMLIDHQAEWKQIFEESWRITRDGFYVENMHGVDWNAIHDKYAALLPYVRHRHDLTYILGEMVGALNVGHAYVSPGELPEIPRIATGLLGARFSRDKATGNFKIEKVYRGATWDKSLRSPLGDPAVAAKVGEYIVKVNGFEASKLQDITEPLVGKVDKIVPIVLASDAAGKKGLRTVYVKPVSDESNLAYYEWVCQNIEKVDKASNGEIGYIHIPDMGREGLDMFTKLFYTQLDKKALIIDDRMNGGGNVSPMILERLQREVYRMNMYRNGMNGTVPAQTHYGPKVCLIDKYSSSDGDLFPYGFHSELVIF